MDNLTPQQLALLQQYAQQAQSGNGMVTGDMQNFAADPNGNTWHAQYNGGWQGGENGYGDAPSIANYFQDVTPGHNKVGDFQNMYDARGGFKTTAAIPEDTTKQQFFTALALAAAPVAAGYAMGGAGAASGGGMTNGAFLGESAWAPSAGGALDFGGAAGAAGGAAGGAGGGVGTMQALPLMEAAPTGVEGLSTIGTGAGLGGKALGLGASLLGAAAGAEGQKNEQTSQRNLPPWVEEYGKKVLGLGSGLLDQQMTPEAQQGYTDMRSRGQGLLNRPMAGNGFDQRNQMGSNLLGQMYPQFGQQQAPQGLLGAQQGPQSFSSDPKMQMLGQPGGMQEGFYPPAMQQPLPQSSSGGMQQNSPSGGGVWRQPDVQALMHRIGVNYARP